MTHDEINDPAEPPFWGWKVASAAAVVLFFSGGFGLYGFSVFVKPLQRAFGWSSLDVAGAGALSTVVFGLAGPFVAWGLKRFGARSVVVGSCLLAGAAFSCMAALNGLPMLYTAAFFSGLAIAGCGPAPMQILLSHWFIRRRGQALGLASLGLGLGGFAAPPIIDALIRSVGWRTTFALGVLPMWLAAAPVAWIWIRTSPAELGQSPDGLTLPRGPANGLTLREALRTSAFWSLFAVQALFMFGTCAVGVHIVPMLLERGNSEPSAAWCWGAAVGVSAAARLAGGWTADRWKALDLMTGACGCLILALAALYYDLPVAFSLLYGLGMGSGVVLIPLLTARRFGLAHHGAILGLVMCGFAPGAVLGPVSVGWLRDQAGRYDGGLMLLILVFSAAALSVRVFGRCSPGVDSPAADSHAARR